MPLGEDPSPSPPRALPALEDRAYEIDRKRRHAARRHFLDAPPYRIEFEVEGAALLCEKQYEYWPNQAPSDVTRYRTISRHRDLEEAERRLRLICTGPIYYDESGRLVRQGPSRRPQWGNPPTDDE